MNPFNRRPKLPDVDEDSWAMQSFHNRHSTPAEPGPGKLHDAIRPASPVCWVCGEPITESPWHYRDGLVLHRACARDHFA